MGIKSIVAFVAQLSKRERTIFYVTVFFVGIVLLDRVMLSPILSKIEGLDEMIQTQEAAIKQSLLIVTQEERIEGESSRYSPYLSKPQAEKKEMTMFLKEVETIAKETSIYLIDIKHAGKDVDGLATRYFVKLNFEAQMEQTLHFFYKVAKFQKLVNLESYQIKPKSEGLSVVTCSASISKTIIPE